MINFLNRHRTLMSSLLKALRQKIGIQRNDIQSNSSSDKGPSTSLILMKDPLPQWQKPPENAPV